MCDIIKFGRFNSLNSSYPPDAKVSADTLSWLYSPRVITMHRTYLGLSPAAITPPVLDKIS